MPKYSYRATTIDGKTVKGLVEAAGEDAAKGLLSDKKLNIIYLSEVKGSFGSNGFHFFNRVSAKDLVIFSRQFSVLVSANVTLVQSLKLLIEQTENIKLKTTISEIADDIDEGSRLSDALGKHGDIFSKFYTNVIKSGETSGKLDEVLGYLADELEKDYDMTAKIKGAMIYPIFVFCGLLAVGAVMMIFVVPKLTAVISESGGELPIATKILMFTSDMFVNFWWLMIIIVLGGVVGLKFLLAKPQAKSYIDRLMLHLPIFGRLFRDIYLVRFTRSLYTLLIGGVNISRGLEIVSEVVENTVYQKLIVDTKKEIEDGNSIASAFIACKEVPNMVSQMLSIGEKTGKLDVILSKITDFYTREINNMIANLMTLMEPIIVVAMGIAVGIMVAAIILPMYNMASQF